MDNKLCVSVYRISNAILMKKNMKKTKTVRVEILFKVIQAIKV